MDYDEQSDDGDSGDGQYPGSHKPVKRPPGPPVARNTDGSWELPGILYAPTARSKFQELRDDLAAYARAIEEGKPKVSDPIELARVEGLLDAIKHFTPNLDKAFGLGQDSKSVTPTLRFCPDCLPQVITPLEKGKQF